MITDNIDMSAVPDQYHIWYYYTGVWERTTFLGVWCLKSVSDLWNYQEILYNLKPGLVVEFGSCRGGSTLFFAKMMDLINPNSRVFAVDLHLNDVDPRVLQEPRIEFMVSSS